MNCRSGFGTYAALALALCLFAGRAQAQPEQDPERPAQESPPAEPDDTEGSEPPVSDPLPPPADPVPVPVPPPTAPAPPAATATATASAPRAEPSDALDFSVSGFTQVDAVVYSEASVDEINPTTGEPLNETTVSVPRARLRGQVRKGRWSAALEIDGNTLRGTPAARLFAAQVAWDIPLPPSAYELPRLRVTAGLFKIPFGGELLEPIRERWFLETTNMSEAFFPGNYDAGARFDARWRYLRLTLAAMNGAPVGDRPFTGRDPTESHDFLGRIGVHTELGYGMRVRAGASALSGTGFHPGTQATKDTLNWVDENEDGIVQLTELLVIKGSPPTPSKTFDRFAFGADISFGFELPLLGHGDVYAEVVLAQNLDRGLQIADPVNLGRDARELGWYIGYLQAVTPHAMVGVRYDTYDPDRDAREQQGIMIAPVDPSFSTLSALVAWRYGSLGRLTLQYDHNQNALGRDGGGQPTTLASDRLTLRAQVKF